MSQTKTGTVPFLRWHLLCGNAKCPDFFKTQHWQPWMCGLDHRAIILQTVQVYLLARYLELLLAYSAFFALTGM